MASVEELQAAILDAARLMNYKLREDQEKAVLEFMTGRDVFVALPTGSGKSLCYSILPFAYDIIRKKKKESIVLVVSPLIALMKDQVRALKERNVTAVYAGEMSDKTEIDVCKGRFQLIFISPESLFHSLLWRDILLSPIYQENLVGFVVDEAHCVQKWGSTFRKTYLEIGTFRSITPEKVNVMALTATATGPTRNSIFKIIGLKSPSIIAKVPNKLNLKYIVKSAEDSKSLEQVFAPLVEEIRLKRMNMDRVIVHCRTYDSCMNIYLYLKSRLKGEIREPIGSKDLAVFQLVDMFTACTRQSVKETILQSFCKPNGLLRVVIATVAFGMGLDCPNVRKIIHWGPSSDIEQYIQEIGRAGRDGLDSLAVLYPVDISRDLHEKMRHYCRNKVDCRRRLLLEQFDEYCEDDDYCSKYCKCCDVCEIVCSCDSCKF